jgi:hypothetical protein
MSEFDPAEAWSLREGIMRERDPVLALIAQKRLELGKQPHWWMPELAPQPLSDREIKYNRHPERDYLNPERDYELIVESVEMTFRLKLINGELACWARPGAPHECHKRLAGSAWGALMVEDWIFGTLRAGTRDERLDFVPVPDGLRYYDARIDRSTSPRRSEKNKGGSPGLPFREAAITAATEYLLDEGDESKPDAIGRTTVFLRDWVIMNDEGGGPSRVTLRTWAEKAVKRAIDTKVSIT